MHPVLRLTEEERRYNDYYDSGTRRGVLERRYPYTTTLTQTSPNNTIVHRTTRRSRVFMFTFSGDLQGVKFKLRTATGEQFIQDAIHLPALVGASPRDPRSRNFGLVPVNFPNYNNQNASIWQGQGLYPFIIEPNIVLPGSRDLYLDFTPALRNDPVLGDTGYSINVIVHVWEFPGFQGGAM